MGKLIAAILYSLDGAAGKTCPVSNNNKMDLGNTFCYGRLLHQRCNIIFISQILDNDAVATAFLGAIQALVCLVQNGFCQVRPERPTPYAKLADSVNSWAREGSPNWEVLRAKGFAVKETDHNLIVRWELSEPPSVDVTDAAQWDTSLGDSDYV